VSRTLAIIGVFLTILYVVLLFFVLHGRIGELSSLKLNEIGDVLAGVFGPLTILWLILGYFQQGIELRNSTRALDLQAVELARSVKVQSETIEISKIQLANEQAQIEERRRKDREKDLPKIGAFKYWCEPVQERKYAFFLVLENCGAMAKGVSIISFPSGFDINPKIVDVFSSDEEVKISWVLDFSVPAIGNSNPYWRINFRKEKRKSLFSEKNISGHSFLLSLYYMYGNRKKSSENYEVFFGPPGSGEFSVEKLTKNS
jgi:hypothetical protein